ncbi:hypothetical protein [uncultured Prevotella sp.]|uniref:hypothetical protein n=1 Tax=uncultured Prevotella sp. TaxID=159272 RepID=UPI00261AFFBD|nr:hypothetical protein [uncultured Prevotella sp.]
MTSEGDLTDKTSKNGAFCKSLYISTLCKTRNNGQQTTMQKTTFQKAKGRLSQCKRMPFTTQKGTKLTEKAWQMGLNRHQKGMKQASHGCKRLLKG